MQQEASESRRDLERRLLEKASRDEAFRRALIEDPKGTIDRELNVKLPEGVSLSVLEETPTSRYLVLPSAASGEGGALSDAELEAVAGGDPPSGRTIATYCEGQSCYTAYCHLY